MGELFAAFGVDWELLLAQAINFGIVLVALWYFLYKPVLATMEERRKVVAKGVEDAKLAEEKLAGADTEAAARVNKADAEGADIVSRARQAASAESSALVESARVRAETLQKDAEARAKEEAARALRESEREIARLAVLAAERVIREKND